MIRKISRELRTLIFCSFVSFTLMTAPVLHPADRIILVLKTLSDRIFLVRNPFPLRGKDGMRVGLLGEGPGEDGFIPRMQGVPCTDWNI